MKAFKIILGIIITAIGLGMTAAGWAIATYGQWIAIINILIGGVLGFLGLGIILSGVLLLTGGTVGDALGGIITATPGHKGVGLHPEDTDMGRGLNNFKYIMSRILFYAFLTIVILLISVLGVGRVLRNFRG